MAAGPVTCAVSPSGRSALAADRTSATTVGGLGRVVRRHRHDDGGRGAVLGDLRGRPDGTRDGAGPLADRREVALGQPLAVAGEEDDGGRPLLLGQLGAQLGGGAAVGVERQRGGAGVGLRRLADDTDGRARPEEGEQGEQPGHPATGDEVGDPAHGTSSVATMVSR